MSTAYHGSVRLLKSSVISICSSSFGNMFEYRSKIYLELEFQFYSAVSASKNSNSIIRSLKTSQLACFANQLTYSYATRLIKALRTSDRDTKTTTTNCIYVSNMTT